MNIDPCKGRLFSLKRSRHDNPPMAFGRTEIIVDLVPFERWAADMLQECAAERRRVEPAGVVLLSHVEQNGTTIYERKDLPPAARREETTTPQPTVPGDAVMKETHS
jgi:hypothetical protein